MGMADLPSPGAADTTRTPQAGDDPAEAPVTQAAVRRLYARPPSFTDQLPWVDYHPESRTFLLEDGVSVAYALFNLEERGRLFIGAQEQVYQGMIIGEHSRDNDLEVNPLKGKKLTNIRASGKDDAVVLTPPVKLSLEEAIAYIDNDELVEVTPAAIRLRKRFLDPHERKRAARNAA